MFEVKFVLKRLFNEAMAYFLLTVLFKWAKTDNFIWSEHKNPLSILDPISPLLGINSTPVPFSLMPIMGSLSPRGVCTWMGARLASSITSRKYRRLNGRISQKDCFILSKLGLLQNAFNTRTNERRKWKTS